jgi:uncharacterized membrane protein YqiK
MAARQDAEANAERARITSAADQEVAKAKGVIKREEAASMKVYKTAEAEAEAERIRAENTRSKELMSMELEKARLEAMPKIVAEMVKPAEKIRGININQVTGLGKSDGGGSTSPVGQTIDSILDMAVALPAMKKIGDQIGVNLDGVMPEDGKKS